MKKMSLPTRILVGMVAGVIVGIVLEKMPGGVLRDQVLIDGILKVCGAIFLNAFRLVVGPVVFVSLVAGVMTMNNPVVLGRIGIKTIAMYLVTTVAAISCGLGLAWLMTPGSGLDPAGFGVSAQMATPVAGTMRSWQETVIAIVPKNAFRAFSDEIMLQIIFLALFCGVALALLGDKVPLLKKLVGELNSFNIKVIDLIMLYAPIGVFALMADTFARFGAGALLPLLKYIVCVGLAMILLILLIYVPLLRFAAKMNPITFFRKYYPVMVLGFSTSSSNAALPLNIETLFRRMGVSESLASLVLSLGATINMNGTAIMQGCAALFIAQLFGVELSLASVGGIVGTAVVASIGTAGVPGAGIIMLAMVLQSGGLPLEGIAILIGVDRLIDMMRTTINVTGDAICACVVAASEKAVDHTVFDREDA